MRHRALLGIVALSLSVSASVTAQTEPGAIAAPARASTGAPEGEVPSNFGTTDFITQWVGAASFTTRNPGAVLDYTSHGFVNQSAGTTAYNHWAPVDLPHGSELSTMRVFYDDTNAANLTVYLSSYQTPVATGVPSTIDIMSVSSTGNAGPGTVFVAVNETINNYPDGATPGGERNYVLNLAFNANGPTLQFRGVRLWWRRVVSPAPLVATYPNDTPTTHPYFRFIEALADAGITGGCAPGSFCPENPITRGEMAVFLSVALGLHHTTP